MHLVDEVVDHMHYHNLWLSYKHQMISYNHLQKLMSEDEGFRRYCLSQMCGE